MLDSGRNNWRNDLGNQRCSAQIHTPDTLTSLAHVVKRCAEVGHIRALGNSYAWSELVPTDGSLVSLARLNRCLEISPHGQVPSIRVECGMSIAQAEAHARAAGLVLCSPPMFYKVSVGGALATGSHGSDSAYGCFSDSVLSATVVTAAGEIVEIDDPEQLAAFSVGLGALGILYAVRLRCESNFALYSEERWKDLDTVLGELPELIQAVRFKQLWWFPHARRVGVKTMFPIDAPIPQRSIPSRISRWRRDRTAVLGGNVLVPAVARYKPELALPMFKLGETVALKPCCGIRSASHEFHFHQGYMPCWDMSFSVPVEYAANAWHRLTKHVFSKQANGVFPVNLAIYSRFTGASNCWLAANHGRDSCFLEVVSARGTPRAAEHFAEIAALMLELPDTRMHWGKYLPDPSALFERYPHATDFLKQRQHWDPDGVFLNPFLKNTVFGIDDATAIGTVP